MKRKQDRALAQARREDRKQVRPHTRKVKDRRFRLEAAYRLINIIHIAGQDIRIAPDVHDLWSRGFWLTHKDHDPEVRELGCTLMLMAALATPGLLEATARYFVDTFQEGLNGSVQLTRVYMLLHGQKAA